MSSRETKETNVLHAKSDNIETITGNITNQIINEFFE